MLSQIVLIAIAGILYVISHQLGEIIKIIKKD